MPPEIAEGHPNVVQVLGQVGNHFVSPVTKVRAAQPNRSIAARLTKVYHGRLWEGNRGKIAGMKQRPHSVAKTRVRKRPNYLPEFLLFALISLMIYLGYWAFSPGK